MALLGFGSENKTTAKKSSDGAYIAPDRTERAQCWEARDSYYSCLDRHDILDSLKEGEKAKNCCPEESKQFERNCASSWVKYFKQRRVADWKKEQTRLKLEKENAVNIADVKDGSVRIVNS
ncbi:hypothetical protein K402DRAFT_337144 [Aulographum hederae CBS 113979]|uniref:Cytochrome c oxidase, subunit VIb n=1 Tax=Aulographum hederae CBS 113979 TaxID=1176131 RepID=A0A6G1GTM1_9PEZI|nr:hypothetical protein K402DRAFT_337144 [Aulographum hederae CBS 113979]